MNKIGKLIKALREERKISQQQLGDWLNCSKQTICNYESGRRRPAYETLEAICDIFNVPRAFFFTEEEKRAELQKLYSAPEYSVSVSNTLSVSKSESSQYQPSPAAIALARLYDTLDERGQRIVDAVARLEAEHLTIAPDMPKNIAAVSHASYHMIPNIGTLNCTGSIETKQAAKQEVAEMAAEMAAELSSVTDDNVL